MSDNVDILNRIVDMCEAEVSIAINPHKSTYETVDGYLKVQEDIDPDMVDPHVRNVMVAMDKIVWVQAYPTTPIGFYVVYHYSVSMALSEMLQILSREDAHGD